MTSATRLARECPHCRAGIGSRPDGGRPHEEVQPGLCCSPKGPLHGLPLLCGGRTEQITGQWPDLTTRLDIWHFMQRMSAGCTIDSHPLYATFMSCLSACIFEWDPEDIALLRHAVADQLRQEGVGVISDDLVDKRITKKDLAIYCRRRTRGEDTTVRLIDQLLQEVMGDKGRVKSSQLYLYSTFTTTKRPTKVLHRRQ